MRFSSLLVTATLSSLALAAYDISLYKSTDCRGSIGHTCKNKQADYCCYRSSTKKNQKYAQFSSADFVERGAAPGENTDRIRAYQTDNSESHACYQGVASHRTCASDDGEKVVTGAQVKVEIVPGRFKRAKVLEDRAAASEPDEEFYEQGTTRWAIETNSAKGKEYAKLEDEKKQIEFLKKNGKKTTIKPVSAAGNDMSTSQSAHHSGSMTKSAHASGSAHASSTHAKATKTKSKHGKSPKKTPA